MSHRRACCCGGDDGEICDFYDPFTQRLCIEVTIAGVQPNPWRLGAGDCYESCAFVVNPFPFLPYASEIRSIAGVNGTFRFRQAGELPVYPANISMQPINPHCEFHDGDPITARFVRISVGVGCVGGTLRLGGVEAWASNASGFGTGHGFLFRWNGDQAIPSGVGSVANQLACENLPDGRSNGPAALGGSAQVRHTIGPSPRRALTLGRRRCWPLGTSSTAVS